MIIAAALDRIAALAPDVFLQIVAVVENLPGGALAAGAVLAHDLARCLSRMDADRAARLFSRFDDATPLIAEVMPYSGVARETLLLWLAEDAPMIEKIRRRRLDRAMSDDILASHAVAAAMAGRHNQMKAYILERAESRRPAVMARALTLAGFSAADEAFDALFPQTRFVDGFLGGVRASAQEAYRRGISAERWYHSALAAESPLDVWRFSELAAAAADARCVLWMEEGSGSDWFEKTRPIFRNALAHSADSAERDRKRNLFGERAPLESLTSTICS